MKITNISQLQNLISSLNYNNLNNLKVINYDWHYITFSNFKTKAIAFVQNNINFLPHPQKTVKQQQQELFDIISKLVQKNINIISKYVIFETTQSFKDAPDYAKKYFSPIDYYLLIDIVNYEIVITESNCQPFIYLLNDNLMNNKINIDYIL